MTAAGNGLEISGDPGGRQKSWHLGPLDEVTRGVRVQRQEQEA